MDLPLVAACTLPTPDQPLRLADWDALFADAVVSAELVNPQRVRATLHARPALAAATADLAVRETECCSFFTVTLTATGGSLGLEITVPVEQTAVLNALVGRIESALRQAQGASRD